MHEHHAIDTAIEQLYFDWLRVVGDAGAAATLTLAQVQTSDRPPSCHDDSLLGLDQAAKYLGYNPAGLRKIVKQQKIQYVQNGRGPIKFKREWLDEFVAANVAGPQDIERSPAQRRTIPISIAPAHGFDPSLFHADSQRGAA